MHEGGDQSGVSCSSLTYLLTPTASCFCVWILFAVCTNVRWCTQCVQYLSYWRSVGVIRCTVLCVHKVYGLRRMVWGAALPSFVWLWQCFRSFVRSKVRSFVCSFVCSFLCSLLRCCVASFLRSSVASLLRCFVPSLLCCFVALLLRSLLRSFLRSIDRWFAFILVASLLRCFVASFLRSFVPSLLRYFVVIVPSFLRCYRCYRCCRIVVVVVLSLLSLFASLLGCFLLSILLSLFRCFPPPLFPAFVASFFHSFASRVVGLFV